MLDERQAARIVDLCMTVMYRYHDDNRMPRRKARMVAEVRDLAAWLMELAPEPDELDQRILRPVQGRLLARFGPELGASLKADFLAAFEDRGGTTDAGSPGGPTGWRYN
jgi:hypothetical protein